MLQTVFSGLANTVSHDGFAPETAQSWVGTHPYSAGRFGCAPARGLGWLENGKFYSVPSSDDDSEEPDSILSGFTISLDGKLLRVDETDASAETEEVGY